MDWLVVCSVYCCYCVVFFFKQKTAYEMRISDWSSGVCSSDLCGARMMPTRAPISRSKAWRSTPANTPCSTCCARKPRDRQRRNRHIVRPAASCAALAHRSDEHTSELQSLMRISYDVLCLKTTTANNTKKITITWTRIIDIYALPI